MSIVSLLDNKNMKPLEKRMEIVEIIRMNFISIKEIQSLQDMIDDKKMALIFEAMEDVTNKNPEITNLDWLIFYGNRLKKAGKKRGGETGKKPYSCDDGG